MPLLIEIFTLKIGMFNLINPCYKLNSIILLYTNANMFNTVYKVVSISN